MIKPLFLSLLLSFSWQAHAAKICYFSLNNLKEYEETSKLIQDLNDASKEPIEVQEYMISQSDPEDSFQKMIDSSAECDGLVISGHHTGYYDGANATGFLRLEFLEKISCKGEYQKFFSRVKALWLEGCRTSGVSEPQLQDNADAHTVRVTPHMVEEQLNQSVADMNSAFSETLDPDNPLSERYQRLFKNSVIFGWGGSAPGVESHSELSLPFHIANLAALYGGSGVSNKLKAFGNLLDRNLIDQSMAAPRNEILALQAWANHGDGHGAFTFNNSTAVSSHSLMFLKNVELEEVKRIECELYGFLSQEKLLSLLDEILVDEKRIGYTFNTIYEILIQLKKDNRLTEYTAAKAALLESEKLLSFFIRKLQSDKLGAIKLINYYAFWKELSGKTYPLIEESIDSVALDFILKPTPTLAEFAFKRTILSTLDHHALLKPELLIHILNQSDPSEKEFNLASTILSLIHYSDHPYEKQEIIFQRLLSFDLDQSSLNSIASSIAESKEFSELHGDLLSKIIHHAQVDDYSLSNVAMAIINHENEIKNIDQLLRDISKSPVLDDFALSRLLDAILNLKYPISQPEDLVNRVFDFMSSKDQVSNRYKRTLAWLQHILKSPKFSPEQRDQFQARYQALVTK